jgi:hypothetical protein
VSGTYTGETINTRLRRRLVDESLRGVWRCVACSPDLETRAPVPSMADEIKEVVSFLDDSRVDVREMAAQGVAGYTASAEGMALLCQCAGLYPRLVGLLERVAEAGCSGAAAAAAATLVNLSQQPAERKKLLDSTTILSAAVGCIKVDEPPELVEYCGMLLSNLTQFEDAAQKLLEIRHASGPAVDTLIGRLGGAALDGGNERFGHISHVLTNLAQSVKGRKSLLLALAGKDNGLLDGLCNQLAAVDETRRLGVARTLRNLCFAARKDKEDEREASEALFSEPGLHRTLITRLAARLAVHHAAYRDNERDSFAPELVAALGPELCSAPEECAEEKERRPQEVEFEGRLTLTEALLLLSASPVACETMRDLGIYPVLRDAHLAEEEEKVREANESLVEVFYLSHSAVGAPPSGPESIAEEPSRVEEVEEVPD